MSKLRSDNGDRTVEEVLLNRLEPWINNPPDYFEMREVYSKYGKLKRKIRLKQREIDRVEEEVARMVEKPRSNDAKLIRNNATSHLKDELAELEAELAEVESEVKALEYMKTMFNAANFRTRLTVDMA